MNAPPPFWAAWPGNREEVAETDRRARNRHDQTRFAIPNAVVDSWQDPYFG